MRIPFDKMFPNKRLGSVAQEMEEETILVEDKSNDPDEKTADDYRPKDYTSISIPIDKVWKYFFTRNRGK